MRSSLRRASKRESGAKSSSKVLSVLGNLLLVIATLAVAGLVAYLVLYPPGAVDETGDLDPLPTNPSAAPSTSAGAAGPTSGAAGPATSGPVGQLSIDTACGAINPLLDRADETRATAVENVDALVPENISDLTRDMQTLSDSSPPEIQAELDPLIQVMVDLNNEVLAGKEFPDIDSSGAEAATQNIRDLCTAG